MHVMNDLAHTQELARLFNEAEAIQQEFERRRTARRLLGSSARWPDDIFDDFDWQHALTTCRQTRAVSLHQP